MNHSGKRYLQLLALSIVLGATPTTLLAEEDPQAAAKADKTGTNPINFTNDFRIYNEYQWLNTAGDGYQNITTLQYRTPFADGKWQFQIKTRGVNISADTNNDGIKDLDALPANARAYLDRLEEIVGVPIDIVSTGPERDETIIVNHPFG